MEDEVFSTDPELCSRWRCSPMKLWRMRKAGKLNSIQPGGYGHPWLTSNQEIARIEAPPPIRKPRPEGATSGTGPREVNSNPTISEPERIPQPRINGGAHG
jgi:hypothetical protein